MGIYKRGSVYWYEFEFGGQRIRESANTGNREIAGRIERERRRKLELGTAGLQESKRPLMFGIVAREWLLNQPDWSASNARIEGYNLDHLLPHFSKMLLTDISADDIKRYQADRRKGGASPRTVNLEVASLRSILRKKAPAHWATLRAEGVRMLKVRGEVGRALTDDEIHRLFVACKKSRSRSLYPAVLLSIHTGLRNSELRNLRWRQIDFLEGQLTVGKSKTIGGDGRIVPLSETATLCLKEWRSQFPDAEPAHFVFPSERYGLDGEEGYKDGKIIPYEVKPTIPIGSWKVAWTKARSEAKVSCRWHDCRHTFVSRCAEGQASDATIMALAGHLSRKMMERYSHVRNEAKRQAIAAFDKPGLRGSPQNPPQRRESDKETRA